MGVLRCSALALGSALHLGRSSEVREARLSLAADGNFRVVAAKVMPAGDDAEREAAVLRDLDHPFVLQFFALLELGAGDALVLCSELCEGDLFAAMASARLQRVQRTRFAEEIALAITYLHSRQLLHGDIKPENIGIGRDGHVRLLDFGLATQLSKDNQEVISDAGTLQYICPEVLRRLPHGLERDWWSFGVMVYELLFAQLPWGLSNVEEISDDTEVSKRICTWALAPPPGVDIEGDAWLREGFDLAQRCLAKDPRHRLTDPHEVLMHPFFTIGDDACF